MNDTKREELLNKLRQLIRAELPDNMDYAMVVMSEEEDVLVTMASVSRKKQTNLFITAALLPLVREPDFKQVYPHPIKGMKV